jgi:hypothetical protein
MTVLLLACYIVINWQINLEFFKCFAHRLMPYWEGVR